MKRYLFLKDYRGRETQEHFVPTGKTWVLDEGEAQLLLSNGWIQDPAPEKKPDPKPEPAPEKPLVVVTKRAKRGGEA